MLTCGDCLTILPTLEAESVDLVFTDPPYGIAESSKLTKTSAGIVNNKEAWGNDFKDSWETTGDYVNWIMPIFYEIYQVLKPGGTLVSFFDKKIIGHIALLLEDMGFKYKNKIYFEKINPVPQFRKNNYRCSMEEAIWMVKNGAKHTFHFGAQEDMTQIYKGVIGCPNPEIHTRYHPCEKYMWMLKPIILNHSNEGDVVLDPFCGSGSTGVACAMLNRQFIGIEKEPKYFEIAKARISAEEAQIKLF